MLSLKKIFEKLKSLECNFVKIISNSDVVSLSLFGIIALVYVPYILKGGFIIDDWGVVYQAKLSSSFWQNYSSWFPLFSNRPLAPLILSLVSGVSKESPFGYIVVNLLLWLSAIFITARIIEKYTSRVFFVVFVLFAFVPVISSTLIFSTAMQLTSTFAFFLWSISLLLLHKYLIYRKKIFYITSYFILLLSFFSYEIVLPLLAIIALFPLYFEYFHNKSIVKNPTKLVSKYFFPVTVAPFIILVYQKLIMPKLMIVYSRMNFTFSWDYIFMHLSSWSSAVFFDLPILLFSSLTYKNYYFIRRIDFWIIFSLLLIICVFLKKGNTNNHAGKFDNGDYFLFFIFSLSFVSGSLLYIFTNTIPTISGYGNRGLSSSWFAFSLVISFIAHKFIKSKFFYFLIGVLGLVILTFIVERNKYIESYNLQLSIVQKVISRVNENYEKLTIASEKSNKIFVIGNVPLYSRDNFNNEEVFDHVWDFGFALNLKSNGRIAGGDIVTRPKVLDGYVSISDSNMTVSMRDGFSANISDIWYYELNQESNAEDISKINTLENFKYKLEYIKDGELDTTPSSQFYETRRRIQALPYIGNVIK